ncbi:letm1 [Symbiodinium natans]|uniref:Letm1 protein n=1 Tax=Symbiodinium natans TaxID=878477 RepID=A0A812V9E5_9DINO|nr:letm1 [Symbiodinium natans]
MAAILICAQGHAQFTCRLWVFLRDMFARGNSHTHGLWRRKKPLANQQQQTLRAWLWDQALHLWHGSRLLAVNARTAWRLRNQVANGQKLTRRERQLLETTAKDLVRLLPFSVFLIIPGAELLLPVALTLFPTLIPSTFTTDEQRRRQLILRNLEHSVVRRRLLEHMVARTLVYESLSDDVSKSITPVFRSLARGGIIGAKDIRRLSVSFEDDGPLAIQKLPRYILRELCQVMGIYTWSAWLEGLLLPRAMHAVRLRFILQQTLEKREEDDRCLAEVDLNALTPRELERENERRRMRWLGDESNLRVQLRDWLELSLDQDIPNHVLLFLRPCATDLEAVPALLTQDERDHILRLQGRFVDSQLHEWIHQTIDRSARSPKDEESDLETGMMQEDIESLKEHVEEVRHEVGEIEATKEQLKDFGQVLKSTSDDELLTLFDTLADDKGVVEIPALEEKIQQHLKDELRDASALHVFLESFYTEDTAHISRADFAAALSRCRQDC